jgi:hypothetical protein
MIKCQSLTFWTIGAESHMKYPFRTGWALVLLGINFLVAAYYFGIVQ